MIQRMQTIFLLVSLVAGVLLFFFPIISFTINETSYHQLFLTCVLDHTPDSPVFFKSLLTLPLIVCQALCLILTVVCIFSYKNRPKQMQLAKYPSMLYILLVIGIFLVYPNIFEKVGEIESEFEFAAYFPLVSLLFLILAYRYIARDEALVRSSDRMR